MAVLKNLIRETTSTTGTGAFIALGGAVEGFITFADGGINNNQRVYYGIRDGASSEFGIARFSTEGSTELIRTQVLQSTEDPGTDPISLSGDAEIFATAGGESFAPTGLHAINALNAGGLSGNTSIAATDGYEVILPLEDDITISLVNDNLGATPLGATGCSFLLVIMQDETTGGWTPTIESALNDVAMVELNTFPVWTSRPAFGIDFIAVTMTTLGRDGSQGEWIFGTHLLSSTYTAEA